MAMISGKVRPPRGARLDPTHPLIRGLVGCWLFNEGGGNLVGDLARRATGTWQGTLGSQWGSSTHGVVGVGNGTDNYLATGKAVLTQMTSFSCAFWFKTTATGIASRILSDEPVGSTAISGTWGLGISSMRPIFTVFQVADNTDTVGLLTSGVMAHVVLTLSGTTLRFYVNGQPTSTKTITLPTILGNPWLIGRRGNTSGSGAEWVNGSLASLLVWSRPLSAADVAGLYARPYQMIAPVISDTVYESTGLWTVPGLIRSNPQMVLGL